MLAQFVVGQALTMIICRRQRHMIEQCWMHAFRCYIFAARIACDSGPTCVKWSEKLVWDKYCEFQQNSKQFKTPRYEWHCIITIAIISSTCLISLLPHAKSNYNTVTNCNTRLNNSVHGNFNDVKQFFPTRAKKQFHLQMSVQTLPNKHRTHTVPVLLKQTSRKQPHTKATEDVSRHTYYHYN